MKFFRRRAGYTLFDYTRNEKNFWKVESRTRWLECQKIQSDWLWHVTKMNNDRMPKIIPNYGSNKRRRPGRPLRILLDEAEISLSRPTSWLIMMMIFNPLNAELNPICYLLALLGAHHFLHVSRIRVKLLTLRLLMSYIYIWSAYSWCF